MLIHSRNHLWPLRASFSSFCYSGMFPGARIERVLFRIHQVPSFTGTVLLGKEKAHRNEIDPKGPCHIHMHRL